MLRQPTEAIADYTRALEVDPEDVASYRYRAQVYEDKAQFGAAIADLDRAINLAEDDADLYAQRAQVLYFVGERRRAVADLGTAIAMKPDDAELYVTRCLINLKRLRPFASAADLWRAWKRL